LRARYGERVTFISVAEDDGPDAAADVARYAAQLGLHVTVVLDKSHALSDRLVLRKLPTTYVVDADGVVRHINNGFGPGYERRLAGWIEQTLPARSR